MSRIPGEVRAAIAAYERAGRELVQAVAHTGFIRRVPDIPEQPRDIERAGVLVDILCDVTRVGVMLTGLAHGGDLVELARGVSAASLDILGDQLVPLVDVRSLPTGGRVTRS